MLSLPLSLTWELECTVFLVYLRETLDFVERG